MPLRDHFRPPVDDRHSWDALHGGWPMVIVQHLANVLPEGYVAAPCVHLGAAFEIDVPNREADLSEQDEYEVRIDDVRRGRRLVAALQLVSPANKDRPESRRAFVAKVAALLQQNVFVSIVDVVTVRQFNLYADLLDLIDRSDPDLGENAPSLYAVTMRGQKRLGRRPLLHNWFYPLILGQPLPALPIWLDDERVITLDLEGSYEATCRALRIS